MTMHVQYTRVARSETLHVKNSDSNQGIINRKMPTRFSWNKTTCKIGVGGRIILKRDLKS